MIKQLYYRTITGVLSFSLICAFYITNGQDHSSDTKVKVKIITEKDGKREVVEKTYSSMEEFKADESVQIEHLSDVEGLHTIDVTKEEGTHEIVKIRKQVIAGEKAYTMKIEEHGKGGMILIDEDGKTYVLQISQGGKAGNKKLLIE